MDNNLAQNNFPNTPNAFPKASIWITNPNLKMLLLVLMFLLLASGIFLVVLDFVQVQNQQKLYAETEAALPKHQAKQVSTPTTLADGRLQVDAPKEGDTVSNTFTVSGYAQGWFEGAIGIKVYDASSTLLYQGQTIAEDNYTHPAPFSSAITLSATSTTPTGHIEFDDYSPRDSSLAYQKIVNINFLDFLQAGREIHKNER